MLLLDLPKPKKVSTEVLVLGGERDTIFPPPEVHATAKAYGTTAVMFDGAHDLMLEPVWPEVAEHIVDAPAPEACLEVVRHDERVRVRPRWDV